METNRQGWAVLDIIAGWLARIFDVTWIILTSWLVYYIRFDHWTMPIPFQALSVIGALLVLVCYSPFGVYLSWRGRRKSSLASRVIAGHTIAYCLLMGMLVITHQADYFSRLWLGLWFSSGLIGAILFRVAVYYWLSHMRALGHNQKRVIIIGTAKSIKKAHQRFADNPWLGLSFHKALLVNRQQDAETLKLEIETLPSLKKLPNVLREDKVREVWICLPLSEEKTINQVLFTLRHSTANIRYFPDFSGYRLLNHRAIEVAGLYALDLSCSPMDGFNRIIKNLEDRILGLFIFFMISPLLLFIAVGVKLSSPGPILFKQSRQGIDGKRFNIYKFRSMKIHQEPEGQITQAQKYDTRITTFGNFLRKTSLDELPQFFNVIQGKMSIVGPRPHAIAHNEQYKDLIESYMKRHKVKPGITGWAQVNGFRGETDTLEKMKKRIEHDLFYIENWSLTFDMKIILVTLLRGFVHQNAY